MGFKMVIVPPNAQPDWPEKSRAAVPDCAALRAGEIARAGLDVYEIEPSGKLSALQLRASAAQRGR
jgi:hypothetical protein